MSHTLIDALSKAVFTLPKAVLLLMLFAFSVFAQVNTDVDPRPLTFEKPIERELKGDKSHLYSLTLQTGQFLYAAVEQKGIDVVVTLLDSDNNKKAEIDSPNGTQGFEDIRWIVDKGGDYRIEVRSLEKDASAGKYSIQIVEQRTSTEKDRIRINADAIFNEALQLFDQGTGESLRAGDKIQSGERSLRRSWSDPVAGRGACLARSYRQQAWRETDGIGKLQSGIDALLLVKKQRMGSHNAQQYWRSIFRFRRKAESAGILQSISSAHKTNRR
jgi:hypothetical protein